MNQPARRLLTDLRTLAPAERGLWRFPMMWLSVLVIVLVPVLYAVIYLGSVWDPYGNLGQLPVALVNADAGTVVRGQPSNLGRDLVAELRRDPPVKFVPYSTQAAAEAAVRRGDVYFALSIPRDFSARALSGDSAQHGLLELYSAPGTSYFASRVGSSVATRIADGLNGRLGTRRWAVVQTSLAQVQQGFSDLRSATGKLRDGADTLAAGSDRLATGAASLAGGTARAAQGSARLATGAASLAGGVTRLTGGTERLAAGLRQLDAAAPGEAQLRPLQGGARRLATGAASLADGLGQLQGGADGLASGAASLASGAARVDAGAGQLAGQLPQLTSGLTRVQGGARQLATGAASLADGAAQANGGAGQLAQQLPQLADGLQLLQGGAQALATGAASLADGATQLQGAVAPLAGQFPQLAGGVDRLTAGAADLQRGAATLAGQVGAATTGAGQAAGGARQLATGTARLQSGARQLTQGATTLVSGSGEAAAGAQRATAGATQLSSGAAGLNLGAQQLQTGAATLAHKTGAAARGARTLAGGAAQLQSGVDQLAAGNVKLKGALDTISGQLPTQRDLDALTNGASTLARTSGELSGGLNRLSDGAQRLATGATSVQGGAKRLRDGLDTLYRKIPASTEQLGGDPAGLAASVQVRERHAAPVANNGTAFSPYFMALSLWVGVTLTTFVFPYLQLAHSGRGASQLARVLRKAAVPALVVTAQALVVVLGVQLMGVRYQNPLGVTLTAVLASLTFLTLVMALILLLGDAGRILSLILLVLQLAASGGSYPVELSPHFFQLLHAFLPVTDAVNAFRASIFGSYDGVYGPDLARMGLTLLVGALAAVLLGRRRWRYVPDDAFKPLVYVDPV